VLVESLRDASRPELELETVRLSGGFSGTLLAEAEALVKDPEALAALWAEDVELRALSQRLRRLGVDALETPRPEWVEQAAVRGVEQLHEEEGT
jgi:hypothetical protein